MIAHKPAETEVAELAERYGLDADGAMALAVAAKLQGQGRAAGERRAAPAAAEDLALTSLTYREVRETVTGGAARPRRPRVMPNDEVHP